MSARTLRLPVALPRASRVERDRVVAGICSGIGEALAVDATLVRLAFAFLAFASGAGIVAYLGAWALLPAPAAETPSRRRRIVGTVLLAWAAILALSGLGLADSLVWPLALVAAGVAIGLPAAFGAARLVRSQLFGLGAADPASFTIAAAVLALVAVTAGLFPARRASRVDPMVALRYE